MATIKFDAVASIGTYKDKDDNEKKRYVNVGKVFESDKGLSLKLDALPLGKDWSGWIAFYEPKARDGTAPAAAPAGSPLPDEDCPF